MVVFWMHFFAIFLNIFGPHPQPGVGGGGGVLVGMDLFGLISNSSEVLGQGWGLGVGMDGYGCFWIHF